MTGEIKIETFFNSFITNRMRIIDHIAFHPNATIAVDEIFMLIKINSIDRQFLFKKIHARLREL
jgi:hypothetical protein